MTTSTRSSTDAFEGLSDEAGVSRALLLAHRGVGLTHPNPMVGAVVAKDVAKGGKILGEGFHTYAERKHAEIIALEKAGSGARGATLYINLEPCCHTGRTGPCTRAILNAGIRRVVLAMKDPNPRVAGRGIRELRAAGIEVIAGMRENEARRLNEAFAKWIRTGLPFVMLKIAATLDGQIAAPAGSVTWITSRESREEVHRLRHAADALLTGIGTVLADDPRMTDRSGLPRRRPLLRVILDSRLRMPLRSKIMRSASKNVLIFTRMSADSPKARQLRKVGAEIVQLRARRGNRNARVDLDEVLRELGRREVLSLLVEGGAALNGAILEENLVDKMILFYTPKILGSTTVPLASHRARPLAKAPLLQNLSLRRFGPDFAVEGYFHDVYRNH